jgi:hypothetical protein
LDDVAAEIDIPTRSLYKIPLALEKQTHLTEADDHQISADALFAIELVDDKLLWARIRTCLETRSPVQLAEVLERFPLEKGLAELVSYVRIASQSSKALVDENESFSIRLSTPDGYRQVTAPFIMFSR